MEPLRSALEDKIETAVKSFENPYKVLARSIDKTLFVINISCLMGDIESLVELSHLLFQRGGSLTVIQPCKPWLETDNLEKAYELYQRHLKIEKILHHIEISQLIPKISSWKTTLENR